MGRLKGYRKRFCIHGHDTFICGRYAGNCKICTIISTNKWDKEHPEKAVESTCRSAKRHPETERKWLKTNPEYHKKYQRKWYKINAKKDYVAQTKHKLKRLKRVPKFGQEGIFDFYQNCPIGYEVDHYYPLNGKEGSGLHVIWNLRYLKARKNRIKSNKWPKDNK
jgi:hypothetical protein